MSIISYWSEIALVIEITCTFLNQPKNSYKFCGVVYHPNCWNNITAKDFSAATESTSSLTIKFVNDMYHATEIKFCFIVTVRNISKTIEIHGGHHLYGYHSPGK